MKKIPPKLTKLSTKTLSKPLATTISNSFNTGMFSDNAKIASFIPWINTLVTNIQ